MNRSSSVSAHRRRIHPALSWARLFAATTIAVIVTYLTVIGAVSLVISQGWTAA